MLAISYCLQTAGAEMNWIEELSGHIKAWIAAGPGRSITSLYREIQIGEPFEISYGTVKNAASGDHATNFPTALTILKIVLPTKEARKAFVEKHFIDYLDFAREFFEESKSDLQSPPSLSRIEAHFFSKLLSNQMMPVAQAQLLLGQSLYENFIRWLTYFKLGRVSGDEIVLNGKCVVVEDFEVVKNLTISAIESIDAKVLDGDLLVMANGKVTRKAAKECWHIGRLAYERCEEIIRNNPGDHTIVTANIMKFD
jgi:hypothetical protein